MFTFKGVRNNWNQSKTCFKKWVFEIKEWQQKLCTNIKVWNSLKTLVFGYCVRVSFNVCKTKEAAAMLHKENETKTYLTTDCKFSEAAFKHFNANTHFNSLFEETKELRWFLGLHISKKLTNHTFEIIKHKKLKYI